jgi:hypothetical protein
MASSSLLFLILIKTLVEEIFLLACFSRKPTTFATCLFEGKKKLVLGLPGNPVSATVTSHLYVLPAMRKMSGYASPLGTIIKATVSVFKCLNKKLRLSVASKNVYQLGWEFLSSLMYSMQLRMSLIILLLPASLLR